jgi:hypothetical protein
MIGNDRRDAGKPQSPQGWQIRGPRAVGVAQKPLFRMGLFPGWFAHDGKISDVDRCYRAAPASVLAFSCFHQIDAEILGL